MRELFDRARTQNKPVLLDFTAKWCSVCKVLDEIIEKHIVPRYGNQIIFEKMDVNEHIDLAKELDIFSVPTLILYQPSGEEIWRNVGEVEGGEIERNLKRAIG